MSPSLTKTQVITMQWLLFAKRHRLITTISSSLPACSKKGKRTFLRKKTKVCGVPCSTHIAILTIRLCCDIDDDRVFLISEELEFRTGSVDGELTLVWRDLSGDVDETYEFVASGANVHTVDFFVQCTYKAMYERKYRKSSDNASNVDLQEFVWQ